MPRWYSLEPVPAAFFDTAPLTYRYRVELPVPAERVWDSLASDASVAAWGPAVRAVRWTSPRPFGVGTTREVELPLGAVTVRERFFRWEEGTRYSFAVEQADRPGLRRFAEDYVLEPLPAGVRLSWTVAIEPVPRALPVMRALGPVTRFGFGQVVAGARRYFARPS